MGHGRRVSVEALQAEVEKLREKYGVAQPAMLVEVAKDPNHALHSEFDWDDSSAGHKYRIAQAQRLITSVKVVYDEQEKIAPAYVSVKVLTADGERRGYVETARALSDAHMRAQVLREAERQLKAWRRRYKDLQELSEVFEAVDAVEFVG